MEERRPAEQREDGAAEPAQGVKGQIEPSCFSEPREQGTARSEGELHVCPSCASRFVHPVAWEPADRRRWSVALRCPECEWSGGGIYGQAAVDRFDEELDQGTEDVVEDLKALARANMEDEIERFVAALEADQVLPEDF